jgi:outer membrane protein assembly factor BamE (lipoprotein component of BamABCDE complex)
MKQILFFFIIFSCVFTSCIVHAPKYTGIEEVLQLKIGMTRDEVSKLLGIPPYDLKSVSDKEIIYIYKYRTTDRNTVPLFMNKTNGVKTKGKWVDLFISYGNDGKVTNIASCSDCETTKVSEKKININTIITLVALLLPSVAVYFGLKNTP